MIVRINQIETARAEQETDWASQGMLGPLWYSWPPETAVYELLILEQDEQQKALGEQFRQSQLRMAIPHAIAAMREAGEEVVMRLDGPLAARELLPAFRHLTESDLTGRFAISEARKLEASPQEVIGSARIQPSPQQCSAICLDPDLGLARSVRLRVFCVPRELVEPILQMTETEDSRWRTAARGGLHVEHHIWASGSCS